MKQEQSILVRAGEPIPWEYTAAETIDVPAIDQLRVRRVHTEWMDVNTHQSPFVELLEGMTTAVLDDGETHTAHKELLALAFRGGGKFVRAYLNQPYWVQTLAEHEAEEAARAELEAMELEFDC